MIDKDIAQVALETGLKPIDLKSGKPIEKEKTLPEAWGELLLEIEKVQPLKWIFAKPKRIRIVMCVLLFCIWVIMYFGLAEEFGLWPFK